MLVQHISSVQASADSLTADEATCLLTADSILGSLRWVVAVYEDLFSEQNVFLNFSYLHTFKIPHNI